VEDFQAGATVGGASPEVLSEGGLSDLHDESGGLGDTNTVTVFNIRRSLSSGGGRQLVSSVAHSLRSSVAIHRDFYTDKRLETLWSKSEFLEEPRTNADPPDKTLIWTLILDYAVAVAIILNGIFIGVHTDFTARHLYETDSPVFLACEIVFCAVFTAELSVRLWQYKRDFFLAPEWKWNLFDLTLVVLQQAELVAYLSTGFSGGTNFTFARVLRVLRVLRSLRLVRLLAFVGELKALACAISDSMKCLLWTVILLLLLIYVVGIAVTQMVSQFRMQLSGEEAADVHDTLSKWWGSLGRSCLSLFEAILGGVDWDDVLQPLQEHISVFLVPAFGVYIAFAMLATMNVITGIFVESALKNADWEKTREIRATARMIFQRGDADRNGEITKDEFYTQIDDPEFVTYLKSVRIDPSDAKYLFTLLDKRNRGSINADELLEGLVCLRSAAKYMDVMCLRRDFDRLHRDWDHWARTLMDSITSVSRSVDRGDQHGGPAWGRAASGEFGRGSKRFVTPWHGQDAA